jgi:hypothetical protein
VACPFLLTLGKVANFSVLYLVMACTPGGTQTPTTNTAAPEQEEAPQQQAQQPAQVEGGCLCAQAKRIPKTAAPLFFWLYCTLVKSILKSKLGGIGDDSIYILLRPTK